MARRAAPVPPLHLAAVDGDLGRPRSLLGRGGDVNARAPDHGNVTPLHAAAEYGRLECARLLLERGADIEARDVEGKSALITSTGLGHLECMRLLLERGADVDAKKRPRRRS